MSCAPGPDTISFISLSHDEYPVLKAHEPWPPSTLARGAKTPWEAWPLAVRANGQPPRLAHEKWTTSSGPREGFAPRGGGLTGQPVDFRTIGTDFDPRNPTMAGRIWVPTLVLLFAGAWPGEGALPPSAAPTRVAYYRASPILGLKPHTNHVAASSAPDGSGPWAVSPEIRPVCFGVFAQMLGEGVAISTVPLFLTTQYGASAVEAGAAVSAFSVAQMAFCPLVVKASGRFGRRRVLHVCLAGATASNVVIALASSTSAVVVGRFLAGIFAASVPVGQAAVTDMTRGDGPQSARALSAVSASSQAGVVLGPVISAVVQALGDASGLSEELRFPAVFMASAALASAVLLSSPSLAGEGEQEEAQAAAVTPAPLSEADPGPGSGPDGRQVMLRGVALLVSWALTLCVATYSVFTQEELGWAQGRLSTSLSAGAAATVATQLIAFPRIVEAIGARRATSGGLALLGASLGAMATCTQEPVHTSCYLLARASAGVADTATAALVAAASPDSASRAANLGYIQSTRAGGRIVLPLLSARLFEESAHASWAPGALPYQVVAALAVAMAPLPSLLQGGGAAPSRGEPEAEDAPDRGSHAHADAQLAPEEDGQQKTPLVVTRGAAACPNLASTDRLELDPLAPGSTERLEEVELLQGAAGGDPKR